MTKRLFRAVRDFVLVRLPLYLRVFAIFLIFASPVLLALYFAPLGHFNTVMYHIPSFALLALSATIFYRLRWYVYYNQDPWNVDPDLLELPRHLRILFGIAVVLLLSAAFFCQGLYEQAALQETARAGSRDDPSNSQCLLLLLRRHEVRIWPITSFRCKAALRLLSDRSGHQMTGRPDWISRE